MTRKKTETRASNTEPTGLVDVLGDLPENLVVSGSGLAMLRRPTNQLRIALLDEAIRTYLNPSKGMRARTAQAEAEAWIDSGRREAFSFVTTCEMIGLNPLAVREELHRRRKTGQQDTKSRRIKL